MKIISKKMLPTDPAYSVVTQWQQQGICCCLVLGSNNCDYEVEIANYSLDATGKEYLTVPPEAMQELGKYYDTILADLLFWERQRNHVIRLWYQHDPEYRKEYFADSPI